MLTRILPSALLLCGLFGTGFIVHAAPQHQPADSSAPRPNAPSGVQLFKKHCAVCHGDDLKGVGPVPEPYKVPPDLSTLARRHGGKFPDSYVEDVLLNGATIPAHGLAQMPAWGTDFREMDGLKGTEVKLRIANLTNYIKSRQVK